VWGSRRITPLILSLGNVWDEWSAERVGHFTVGEGTLLLVGGWAPGPTWTFWRRAEAHISRENRTADC